MKTILAITVSALFLCPVVWAQTATPPVERFTQLDKNSDGKLNAEEFPVMQFTLMDKDGDGFLTLEEIKTFYASNRQRKPVQNPAALQAGSVPMKTFFDLPYAKIEGAEPKLTSLDIYAPRGVTNAPVLVWVHGGGWARGDKSQVAGLPAAFVREGFVVASVNYRLAPAVRFDARAQDVAAAIAWMRKHAKAYGGAPEAIFLMGHSAGAHLVALVGTDEGYLKAHGLSLSALRGVVPLDTEAYDLKGFAARFGGKLPELCAAPFTQDPAAWARASPATHVAKGKGIPPMIVAYSGGQKPHSNPNRTTDAEEFVAKLKAAGVGVEVIAAPEKTHAQVALEFGTPGDRVAASVFSFLKGGDTEDVQMGDAQFAYIDPEFLQGEGKVVFLDSKLNVWVGKIDPANGLFRSPTGRDHRVDTGISQWSRHSNGPEWGFDAKGPALFYVKDNAQGAGQLWRATPAGVRYEARPLTTLPGGACGGLYTQNQTDTDTRLMFYLPDQDTVVWASASVPNAIHELPDFRGFKSISHWVPGTKWITYARTIGGSASPQLVYLDTETGAVRQVSDEPGDKFDAWGFRAPEFGGEVLMMCVIDRRQMAIYRDLAKTR
ncbi:MAG: hypothetical protein FJY82_08210 [Candidatus Aminicenantes bacterium]|nr:hypothetical protein [Candidatus Aminicenantes bacterium]